MYDYLYSCFFTPVIPAKAGIQNRLSDATRRHFLIGRHSAGKNVLDSRLRGNDDEFVFI
jgi:hypothetical protein